ncbi:pyridoxal-dependent decarboxylase domain-containing protein 1-like isoform X2 [Stegodyphus dumicola]|uniref:pyridoxal-dependent decarboxylase domain-containing protein 1-like isoform X2 n=1 Tax=Stegodyphus dumicola TaxID=202533 RepID=UPI0015AF1671|nr:pyridoxal-dependent decarboxylase domain-containing protein 1-like isoform X2 [Stegodyphus dumicola]
MAETNGEPVVNNTVAESVEDFSESETTEVDHAAIESLHALAVENLDLLQDSIYVQNSSLKEKYVPGPLTKEGKSFEDVKQYLLGLIARSEAEEEEELAVSYIRPRRHIDSEVQKAALFSHTLAAYISTMSINLVCRITMQMVSDTSLWISKTFRFFDSLAYFNKDSKEGLIRVIRMVLHSRYMRYSSTGYEALFTRPPVIYYCDCYGVGKYVSHLCSQLGLPLSCITAVPCLPGSEGRFRMDTAALERCIKDDLSATRTPLLVIANAGMHLVGYVDNLQKIQEICLAHNVWLHVQGHSLAALSLVVVPNLPSNLGDSMTLSLGNWIGLPSLPYITLYKAKEMAHVHAAGLGQASYGHLDFLPVWVAIQILGQENLTQRICHCFELADGLLSVVERFSELRIISKKKVVTKDGQRYEVSDIGDKSIPTMVLFEALTTVVVFQYVPRSLKNGEQPVKNPPYYDNLNSWLVQLMARQVPNIKTEIIELEDYGICLRICPLESAHLLESSKEDVEQYFICLQQQINILNSTVIQKEKLYKEHKNHRKLQLVEIANWAGMGGIRYIPEFWADRLNELTDTGKADINQLNSDLVTKLRATDSAFSLGEADDGMLCVRFGMVDDNLDMDELISLVVSAGQELEESSKFLETMSEMIKHGIEEANKELIQENQEKILQEGVLRQVPVLGSLVSWWYPTSKETGIKGRSFNLSSGTIESTENIYKYHMQIKEGSKSPQTSTKVLVSSSSSQSLSTEQKDFS